MSPSNEALCNKVFLQVWNYKTHFEIHLMCCAPGALCTTVPGLQCQISTSTTSGLR